MSYDAPLLFTTQDPKRNQLVHATITARQADAIARKQKQPVMVMFQLPDDRIGSCPGNADPAGVDGLSTLAVPNQPLQLPPVFAPRDTLAPVVVFAAAIEPADPPDVAVGMALAAHMARADGEVSLVVVPHYLESDPKLENKLEKQHEPVTGGVVLGQTPTVPEDTRVLLRQLLTSRDQLGLIAQVQGDLGGAETLITALLALLAVGVLTREAPEIKEQTVWLIREAEPQVGRARDQVVAKVGPQVEKVRHQVEKVGPQVEKVRHQVAEAGRQVKDKLPKGKKGKRMNNGPIPAIADLRIALRDQQLVTIWLRNGWKVTGTTGGQVSRTEQGNDPTVTVLRLENVTLEKAAAQIGTADSVLVPIGEIDLIATGFSNPAHRGTTAGNPAADAGDGTA
jgi:hypothetical protein